MFLLFMLFISNAVILKRDKSISYSRTVPVVLVSMLVFIGFKLPINYIFSILGINYIFPIISGLSSCLIYIILKCYKRKAEFKYKELLYVFTLTFIISSLVLTLNHYFDILAICNCIFLPFTLSLVVTPEGHLTYSNINLFMDRQDSSAQEPTQEPIQEGNAQDEQYSESSEEYNELSEEYNHYPLNIPEASYEAIIPDEIITPNPSQDEDCHLTLLRNEVRIAHKDMNTLANKY